MYVHVTLSLVRNVTSPGKTKRLRYWEGEFGSDLHLDQAGHGNGIVLLLTRISIGLESDQDNDLWGWMSRAQRLANYQPWDRGPAVPFSGWFGCLD